MGALWRGLQRFDTLVRAIPGFTGELALGDHMATLESRVRPWIAVCAVAIFGCAKYEPVPGHEALTRTSPPPECFERPTTLTPVPTPLAPGPASAPAIAGVVQDEHGRPVVGAAVDLRGDSVMLTLTDSTGRFAFSEVPRGQYQVRLRALGYNILNTGITRADTVPQEYRIVVPTLILDGPCNAVVVVKQPWWKRW